MIYMEEEAAVRNVTAAAGLLAGASVLLTVPLYFMYGGAPPAWNVLTRDLITLLSCAGSLVFMAGISHLAARLRPAAGFAALPSTCSPPDMQRCVRGCCLPGFALLRT
jgi:hypothetical protein